MPSGDQGSRVSRKEWPEAQFQVMSRYVKEGCFEDVEFEQRAEMIS